MKVAICKTVRKMAQAAAELAAADVSRRIAESGRATFMAATGGSQFAFLDALTRQRQVDWARTEMFHLDEYIGLPETHPASFRRYLQERLLDVIHPGSVHLINGNAADPWQECARLAGLMPKDGVDIAFVGIGENGHLAFNDPPADFADENLFIVVTLPDSCRSQQVHEGWFSKLEDVPGKAITVTIRGILKSKCIVAVVPEERKAVAIRCALSGGVRSECPHPPCWSTRGRTSSWTRRRHPCWIGRPYCNTRGSGSEADHEKLPLPNTFEPNAKAALGRDE